MKGFFKGKKNLVKPSEGKGVNREHAVGVHIPAKCLILTSKGENFISYDLAVRPPQYMIGIHTFAYPKTIARTFMAV